MSFGISKACFPPASLCHNCTRKSREDILEKTDEKKDFLRCCGCHLMTYCDKDCQREHWQKVHKLHCKFLSGKKGVENSRHSEDSCSLCIEDKMTSNTELLNIKSPKTACHIEEMVNAMKKSIGRTFEFHKEGKTCECSSDFACELPLPLGEVSEQYVGLGRDAMLAHAIKITTSMGIKESGARKDTLVHLLSDLIEFRSTIWSIVLVDGGLNSRTYDAVEMKKRFSDPVDKLKAIYGPSNAWWKVLMITVKTIVNMNDNVNSNCIDSSSIEGPMFRNLKLYQDYYTSNWRNQVYVNKNNLWPRFKLWPTLAGDSLVMLLPDGTRCQTCTAPLNGEVIVSPHEGKIFLPMLMRRVMGENGVLVVCCPFLKNPKCLRDCLDKDELSMDQNPDRERDIEKHETCKNYLEEYNKFYSMGRNCDFCLKTSLHSHRCSDCYAAQYCSTQCQLKDLDFHKTMCSTWANDKFRKIISSKQPKKISKLKVDGHFKPSRE